MDTIRNSVRNGIGNLRQNGYNISVERNIEIIIYTILILHDIVKKNYYMIVCEVILVSSGIPC